MAQLTPAAPRLRSSDGTFSRAGEITAALIRKAYGRIAPGRPLPIGFSGPANVIEFSGLKLSLGTAKRALAELKKDAVLVRPPSLKAPGIGKVLGIRESKAVPTGGVIPDKKWNKAMREELKRVGIRRRVAIPAIAAPQRGIAVVGRDAAGTSSSKESVSTALHELGHLRARHDPTFDEAVQKASEDSFEAEQAHAIARFLPSLDPKRTAARLSSTNRGLYRAYIGSEREANAEVRKALWASNASEGEMASWDRTARRQQTDGYAYPRLRVIRGLYPQGLAGAKQMLREHDSWRMKNQWFARVWRRAAILEFSSRDPLVEFGPLMDYKRALQSMKRTSGVKIVRTQGNRDSSMFFPRTNEAHIPRGIPDPLQIAVHESGHSVNPPKRYLPIMDQMVKEENRANRNALDALRSTGASPATVSDYRSSMRRQIHRGYQAPFYEVAKRDLGYRQGSALRRASMKLLPVGAPEMIHQSLMAPKALKRWVGEPVDVPVSLAQKKAILRKLPILRSKAIDFSSR